MKSLAIRCEQGQGTFVVSADSELFGNTGNYKTKFVKSTVLVL